MCIQLFILVNIFLVHFYYIRINFLDWWLLQVAHEIKNLSSYSEHKLCIYSEFYIVKPRIKVLSFTVIMSLFEKKLYVLTNSDDFVCLTITITVYKVLWNYFISDERHSMRVEEMLEPNFATLDYLKWCYRKSSIFL